MKNILKKNSKNHEKNDYGFHKNIFNIVFNISNAFCYQQFFIFIFLQTTQHNIQNKTKQNSRHILNI